MATYQTGTTSSGTASLSITIPSGVTIGHWAYLGVGVPSTTTLPSAPSGWTSVTTAAGGNARLAVFRRQIQAGDASSVVTLIASGGDTLPKLAVLVTYDGDGSTVLQDAISPGGNTTVTWSATVLGAGQRTLRFVMAYNTSAQPAFGFNNGGSLADTSRQPVALSAGGTVMAMDVADSAASAGATEPSETTSWIPTSSSAGISLVIGTPPVNATVTGVVASRTLTAPAGTAVGINANASVTGVIVSQTTTAPAGSLQISGSVAGPVVTRDIEAVAGEVVVRFAGGGTGVRSRNATGAGIVVTPQTGVIPQANRVLVSVYEPDGVTLIANIVRRRNVKWQDELNVPGTGQFDIHLDDPLIADNPDLLDDFNIVRFFLNGIAIKAWQIEDVNPVFVGPGEVADRWVVVSGRGIQSILETAIVYPEYGLRANTKEDRQFDFSSKDGVWRVPTDWQTPVGVTWSVSTARVHMPPGWPDPLAKWIWSSSPNSPALPGRNWFRGSFTLAAPTNVVFYAACDNNMSIRLDGEVILTSDPAISGFSRVWQTTQRLEAGTHLLAAWVDNTAYTASATNPTGSNPAGFLLSAYQATSTGAPTSTVLFRTDTTRWIVKAYGTPPGWRACSILQQLIIEAQGRNVRGLLPVTFGFTNTLDSAGVAWTDTQDRSVKVGTTDLSDLATQLIELTMDIELDPHFVLRAWKHRGSDKSASVRILPNRDITASSATVRSGKLRNQAVLHSDSGWIELFSSASKEEYGRRETGLSVGNAGSNAQVVLVGTAAMQEVSRPEVTIPVSYTSARGPQPYKHYFLGDVISTPGRDGTQGPGRVMAITATENETSIQWDLDVYPHADEDKFSSVVVANSSGSASDPSGLYQAEVLSDSPWGYWREKETGGTTLADISGNHRSMTIAATSSGYYVLNAGGPVDKAIKWNNAASAYAITANTTAGKFAYRYATMEAWVWMVAYPTSVTSVLGMSTVGAGGNPSDKQLYIDATGHVSFFAFQSATNSRVLKAPSPLSLSHWHHIACSVGTRGMRIYVDGALVASTTLTTSSYSPGQRVMIHAGGGAYNGKTTMYVAEPAVYYQQLLDSRIASHYRAASALQ